MSNNSWKQYGGISKMDSFNTINASTIIADQFISRSTRPTYQYLNGTFEVSLDLSATVKFVAEVISVKKKDDRIIEGNPDKIKFVTDVWKFTRNINNKSPNWYLAEIISK